VTFIKRIAAFLVAVLALPIIAHAQSSATVVTTCGTPPSTYSSGQNRSITQDTTGTLCTAGSGGGGAVGGTSTTAAPSYVNNATNQALSLNLSGDLRTISKVTDGTNITAVKAASTAAGATDPALVVALSPNGLNANGQATMANSAPVVIASNQSALTVNLAATTIGGCTPGVFRSAATTNSTNIKASAGTLCSLTISNIAASTVYYLRLYDSASAPTCSSGTGEVGAFAATAGATAPLAAPSLGQFGLKFANGIAWCLTGGNASTDNTAAATGVTVNYSYN